MSTSIISESILFSFLLSKENPKKEINAAVKSNKAKPVIQGQGLRSALILFGRNSIVIYYCSKRQEVEKN
jgi:hypothetical protein